MIDQAILKREGEIIIWLDASKELPDAGSEVVCDADRKHNGNKITCDYCDEQFDEEDSYTLDGEKFFCSKDCMDQFEDDFNDGWSDET